MLPGRAGGVGNVSCSKRLAEPLSHPLGDGHLKMAGFIATIAAGPTEGLPLPGCVCRSDYLLVAPNRRNEMPSGPEVLPNKIPLALSIHPRQMPPTNTSLPYLGAKALQREMM
jgi:hypothetical protein